MAALWLDLILLMAIMGTATMVTGARLLSTTDEAKIAAVCSSSYLECAHNTLISKATGISQDKNINTINELQRDFFLESTLQEGNTMTLDGNLRDSAPKRAFFTSSAAMTLPALTSDNALELTKHFGVAPDSDMATAVATAAYLCGYGALPGEKMACVASADAMAAFVSIELGDHVKVLYTSNTPSSAPAVKEPVTIVDVTKGSVVEGKTIVVCHVVDFPSALYYCHRVTGTKVIRATLKPAGSHASPIKAVGVCHIDTSLLLSTHPAFTALNIPRGEEACHWLVDSDLVFVPVTSGTEYGSEPSYGVCAGHQSSRSIQLNVSVIHGVTNFSCNGFLALCCKLDWLASILCVGCDEFVKFEFVEPLSK